MGSWGSPPSTALPRCLLGVGWLPSTALRRPRPEPAMRILSRHGGAEEVPEVTACGASGAAANAAAPELTTAAGCAWARRAAPQGLILSRIHPLALRSDRRNAPS